MNKLSKIYAFISLIRVINVLITFCSVIVAVIICSDISVINQEIILAAVCAALVAAAGNVINDIWDYDSDLINKPDRPIPSGAITKKSALNFYFSLILLSVLIAMSFNLVIFSVIILSHLLLVLYTTGLKKIPLLGNLVISFLTGFVFIYGGLLTGNTSAAVIPAGFALMVNLSREGIKTIEDIPGDKSTGTITFPQIYGITFTRKLVSAFLVLLLVFTFVPFVKGLYGIEYFITVMAAVNPMLVYVIVKLLQTGEKVKMNNLSIILKLVMIFGLTAIYLGR